MHQEVFGGHSDSVGINWVIGQLEFTSRVGNRFYSVQLLGSWPYLPLFYHATPTRRCRPSFLSNSAQRVGTVQFTELGTDVFCLRSPQRNLIGSSPEYP